MRKVIFEQVGNIILTILLTIAVCDTMATSTFMKVPGTYEIGITFGWPWYIFLSCMILFYVIRTIYAKKLGKKDGYTKKYSEFSSQDEREYVIGGKSAKVAYRVGVVSLLIIVALSIYANLFFQTRISLIIAYSITAGIFASITFLSYLAAWIFYDSKG